MRTTGSKEPVILILVRPAWAIKCIAQGKVKIVRRNAGAEASAVVKNIQEVRLAS